MDILLVALMPAGVIALSLLLGYLTHTIMGRYILPHTVEAPVRIVEIVLREARKHLLLWFVLVGTAVAVRTTRLTAESLSYVDKLLVSLLILSVTLFAVGTITKLIHHYGNRVEALKPLSPVLERITQILVLVVGLLTILSYLDISITPIITTLGVAGLATALALQDTLANFFAGFYILADRPIRVGDYVKLSTGEEGYVVDVGWRHTKIRNLPNNVIIIPNQKLAQSIITNYHLPENRMALLIPVSVSYNSDPREVERVLTEVATEASHEVDGLLADPAPFVRFIPGFGAYSLDFTLICQVREFVDQYYVQHELRKRIFDRLKKERIEIPFPITTIHLPDSLQHKNAD